MLSKQHRLAKNADVLRVHKKGRSVRDAAFGIRVLANNIKFSRFAFIVANKVSKKAVVRNRLCRRMREVVKANMKNIHSSYDVCITAFARATECDFKEIKQRIEALLKKSKLS